MRLRVEDPTGIGIEEEGEGAEFGHLLKGFCEEIVKCVMLLSMHGYGEASNMAGGVWANSEGVEDG